MEKANWMRSEKMSFEREKTSTGYSWPQRNYPCAFCKKQFKSAQALGGHMNIHRRERAQLRSSLLLSPTPTTLDFPNPNPSPWFSLTPSLGSSLSSSKSLSQSARVDQRKKNFRAQEEEEEDDESRVLKKNEKTGLGRDLVKDGKEDLDLELRLWFS